MGRTRPSAGRERVLGMEPTFHCDLARRCWRLGRSSCTRIAALTRQMTVATYPAPIADLRGVRPTGGVFLYCARRVITRPRADHRRSRSGLGQGRYGLRLAVDCIAPDTAAVGGITQLGWATNNAGVDSIPRTDCNPFYNRRHCPVRPSTHKRQTSP
jgi:hypothetical protein